MIRPLVEGYQQAFPALLEIPSKEHPYGAAFSWSRFGSRAADPSKDSVLKRSAWHAARWMLIVQGTQAPGRVICQVRPPTLYIRLEAYRAASEFSCGRNQAGTRQSDRSHRGGRDCDSGRRRRRCTDMASRRSLLLSLRSVTSSFACSALTSCLTAQYPIRDVRAHLARHARRGVGKRRGSVDTRCDEHVGWSDRQLGLDRLVRRLARHTIDVRLGGPAIAVGPRDDNERRSSALARPASLSVRRA